MRDLAHLFEAALRRYRPAEAAAAAAVQAPQGGDGCGHDRSLACDALMPCACASAGHPVEAAALSIQRLRLPHMHTDVQVARHHLRASALYEHARQCAALWLPA